MGQRKVRTLSDTMPDNVWRVIIAPIESATENIPLKEFFGLTKFETS